MNDEETERRLREFLDWYEGLTPRQRQMIKEIMKKRERTSDEPDPPRHDR